MVFDYPPRFFVLFFFIFIFYNIFYCVLKKERAWDGDIKQAPPEQHPSRTSKYHQSPHSYERELVAS